MRGPEAWRPSLVLGGMGPAAVVRGAFTSTSRARNDKRRACKPYISAFGSEHPIDGGVESAAPGLGVRWVFGVREGCFLVNGRGHQNIYKRY